MTAPRPTGSIDIWNFVDNVTGTTVRKWLRDSWARRKIVALQQAVAAIVVPTKTSELTNDSGFITSADIPAIPTKTSDLTNDSGFITSAPVASVNGQTGAVNLGAADVGALPDSTTIPSKTSDLTNDSGFITASSVPSASSVTPTMDGTASAGSSTAWARGDHVHPHDSSKQDALTSAQLAAVNSGITADDLAVNDASVLCTVTPIVPTLNNGNHYATFGGCWYYKIGHRVTVHIGVSGLTTNTDTTLWTLPTGYIPKSQIGWNGTAGGISSLSRFRIDANGNVRTYSAAAYALGEISFDAFS